jgi:hypothetical protein
MKDAFSLKERERERERDAYFLNGVICEGAKCMICNTPPPSFSLNVYTIYHPPSSAPFLLFSCCLLVPTHTHTNPDEDDAAAASHDDYAAVVDRTIQSYYSLRIHPTLQTKQYQERRYRRVCYSSRRNRKRRRSH